MKSLPRLEFAPHLIGESIFGQDNDDHGHEYVDSDDSAALGKQTSTVETESTPVTNAASESTDSTHMPHSTSHLPTRGSIPPYHPPPEYHGAMSRSSVDSTTASSSITEHPLLSKLQSRTSLLLERRASFGAPAYQPPPSYLQLLSPHGAAHASDALSQSVDLGDVVVQIEIGSGEMPTSTQGGEQGEQHEDSDVEFDSISMDQLGL
jgi:hypothetical protein